MYLFRTNEQQILRSHCSCLPELHYLACGLSHFVILRPMAKDGFGYKKACRRHVVQDVQVCPQQCGWRIMHCSELYCGSVSSKSNRCSFHIFGHWKLNRHRLEAKRTKRRALHVFTSDHHILTFLNGSFLINICPLQRSPGYEGFQGSSYKYCDMTPKSRNSSLLGNDSVNMSSWK
jgi:hypothetical protein